MSSSASSWRKSRANRINRGWVKSISDGFPCLLFSLHRCGGLRPFFSPCSYPLTRGLSVRRLRLILSQTPSDANRIISRFPHLLRKSALRRVQGRPQSPCSHPQMRNSLPKGGFPLAPLNPFGCIRNNIFIVVPWQTRKSRFPHLLRESALRRVQGRPRTSSVFQPLLASADAKLPAQRGLSVRPLKPLRMQTGLYFHSCALANKKRFPHLLRESAVRRVIDPFEPL